MSNEKKTIQINPDLFKVSKKRSNPNKNTSKISNIVPKEKKSRDKTIRKNVLKMIREKQQEEYDR